ncbi:MAG: sulfurtransferase [Woeseia sp.]|nr:sulfurtransferase [Woeseia sp.]MBT8095596.1 sulfurtransferase [Woeseia sp.]NNE61234.1 sulfurtransferase [Woeseia sp.]NNL53593.1 sulfurtransferase [Woeseia sp.]
MFEDMRPAEWLQRKESDELWQLLDVRESWEIEIAAIDGAVCIPMGEVPLRLDELDPMLPIAVLCHAGHRSAQVAALLDQSGFVTVVNIEGGIDAWAQDIDSAIPRY